MPRTVIILLLLTAAVMAGCTRRDRGLDARVDALRPVTALTPGGSYTVEVTIGSVNWTGDFTWDNN